MTTGIYLLPTIFYASFWLESADNQEPQKILASKCSLY